MDFLIMQLIIIQEEVVKVHVEFKSDGHVFLLS